MNQLAVAVARECDRMQMALGSQQQHALAEFFGLLAHWGKRIRLTGTLEEEELVHRHLADALVMARSLPQDMSSYIDVGSGGGLPALPFALLYPGLRMTLVEANGRKATFLRTAAHQLGLGSRVEVLDQRLEQLSFTEPFELAGSRATFAPETWVEHASKLVGSGGHVLVFVGQEQKAPEVHWLEQLLLSEVGREAYELPDGTPRLLLCYQRGRTDP